MRVFQGMVRAFTLIVVTAGAAAQAQTTFEYVQGGSIEQIKFVDSSNGFLVADGGRIHYSQNGGVTWLEADTDDSEPETWGLLHGICFRGTPGFAGFKGWAVGEGGVILGTTDNSGTAWEDLTDGNRITSNLELKTSPSDCGDHPAILRDIVMITDSEGWAVGDDGTIVSTANNWTTWTRETGPSPFTCGPDPNDIYQIHFFAEHATDGNYVPFDKGIMASEYGRVFLTDDGGANWTEQVVTKESDCNPYNLPVLSIGDGDPNQGGHNGHNLELWEIAFDDPDDADSAMTVVGGVGNSQGYIYRRGTGWNDAACAPWEQESDYDFVDPSHQSHEDVCGLSTLYSADILDLSATPPKGVVAGYAGHFFTRSTSGMSDFDTANCSDDCTGGCPTGIVWEQHHTVDDGGSSPSVDREFPFGNNAALLAGARVSDNVAVVGGHFGVITRYVAGASDPFTEVGTKWVTRLTDCQFWSSTHGVVVGQHGQIMRTTDGGASWTEPSVEWDQLGDPGVSGSEVAAIHAVAFSDSGEYGVAVGTDGHISFSDDYGATWDDVVDLGVSPYEESATLNDVKFVYGTVNTFVAAGDLGRVIISTDGGETWVDQELDSAHQMKELHGVHFVKPDMFTDPPQAPKIGYVVGQSGRVLKTTNGGSTWADVAPSGVSSTTFFDVRTWDDGSEAVIVGQNGLVYEDTGSGFVKETLSSFDLRGINLLDIEEFGDGATLRVSGQKGTVLFRDSGTWTQVRSRTSEDMPGISFLSADEGFGIGTLSLVVKYDDT